MYYRPADVEQAIGFTRARPEIASILRSAARESLEADPSITMDRANGERLMVGYLYGEGAAVFYAMAREDLWFAAEYPDEPAPYSFLRSC